jgi:cytochrome c-type biogenesis protein CcmH/NrfG
VNLLADYLLSEPVSLPAITLLGQALLDDRRPAEAVAAFQRVLRYIPDDLTALFHLGVTFARLRRYQDGIVAWERIVTIQPTGPLAAQARQHVRSARDLARILVSPGP